MARPNGYLLDTNIIVALARGGALGAYLARTYGLTADRRSFYVPVVVVGEARSLSLKWGWGGAALHDSKRLSRPTCNSTSAPTTC